MLKVTLEAARQIRQAAMQSGADDMALRVAATRDPKGDIRRRLSRHRCARCVENAVRQPAPASPQRQVQDPEQPRVQHDRQQRGGQDQVAPGRKCQGVRADCDRSRELQAAG